MADDATPRFPDLTITVQLSATHADNRTIVLQSLIDAGEMEAAVEFIGDVARETEGRLHRSRWIGVAKSYVRLKWTP